VSSLGNGQDIRLIIEGAVALAAIAACIFSFISNSKSKKALILSKEANNIANEVKEIAKKDNLRSRTPIIIIKDQILDEYWDTNPLVFDESSQKQYHDQKRSVGIVRVKARRKDSDGISQPYYAIALNSANNERPDYLYGTDNFSTVILASVSSR
jgi:hypothetical protein